MPSEIPSLHERQAAFIPAAHTGNRPNAPNLREGGIDEGDKHKAVFRDVCSAGRLPAARQKPLWMREKTMSVKMEICEPTKERRKRNGDQHGEDFRHEGQGHFLDLGQRLNEGDDDTNDHGGENGGPGGDDHGPDRRLHDIEGIRLIHQLSLHGNTRAHDKLLAGIKHRDDSIRI